MRSFLPALQLDRDPLTGLAGLRFARARLQTREGAAATPATSPQQQQTVPFTQASKPEIEPGPSWSELTLTAASQELGSVTIPANGFIGGILIDLETTTNGVEGTGEKTENYPFNMFEQVRLTEPNGAPIGLELNGWQTLLADIYGGYAGCPDPRNDPDFSETLIKPSFTLRLPIEISPNALGILGNQSSAAAFRLTLKLAPSTAVYKKALTTNPKFSVRTFIELWGEPPERDIFKRPNKQVPDYAGTAQYWSVQAANKVAKAQNTIKMTRVGSQIRTLIFEFAIAGVRSDAAAPDPFEVQLDNRIFRQYSRRMLRKFMREMVESLTKRDVGIYAISFSKGEGHHVGENAINSWLATLTATRLELRGPAEAEGEVNFLTNDVSVAPPNPSERTPQVNAGAYHAPIGVST
jgi:hypothetical protein